MDFSTDIFLDYLTRPEFLSAAGVTLAVAVAAQLIGIAVGLVLALFGMSRYAPLRWFTHGYIWLIRGTPPLVQLMLLYFGLPQLGIRLTVLQAGLIGLGAYAGAFMAEIIRSGLASVSSDQMQAARSMGFSRLQSIRYVVMPQALRVMLPPFGNEFASMMRTTSLLSVISFEELLRVTRMAINETYRVIELYSVAAVYYLAMYSLWLFVQAYLEKAARRGVTARPATAPTEIKGAQ
ncbi:amino acid ABC transporter permease [Pelagovum pacificum]|uniref:Amino acid ABC transporter permease n=1 Tax=Pelagovum pacificum TaxID=2588711 RepID=A0A5C5G786_9RHOB|nr:amino acid ABC transporter permease [Pelagovum pacificum]QQA41985.1 amino acid ABC transporter permease [Pelagovum pacificum]TNY30574.1 amino acid ABC transporter permease [Pelagovum pacificum]